MKKQFLHVVLFLTTAYASTVDASFNELLKEENKNTKFIFVTDGEINSGENKNKTIVKIVKKNIKIKVEKPFGSNQDEVYDGCMNQGGLLKEDVLNPQILLETLTFDKKNKLIEGQNSPFLKLHNNLIKLILNTLDTKSLWNLRQTCKFFNCAISLENPWNFTNVTWKTSAEQNQLVDRYKSICTIFLQRGKPTLTPYFYFHITSLLPDSSTISVDERSKELWLNDSKMPIGVYLRPVIKERVTFEKIQKDQRNNGNNVSLKVKDNMFYLYSCEIPSYATILCANNNPDRFLKTITIEYKGKILSITPAEFKEKHGVMPRMLILEEKNKELEVRDFRSLSQIEKMELFGKINSEKVASLKKSSETK